jgi:hypothetical protein
LFSLAFKPAFRAGRYKELGFVANDVFVDEEYFFVESDED